MRRLLRWAALGVVAALAALTIGGIIWLRSYRPLEWAGGYYSAESHLPSFYDSVPTVGAGTLAGGPLELKTAYIYRFRPGQRFRFGFDVHNGGRFDVHIDGVETSTTGALMIVGADLDEDVGAGKSGHIRPMVASGKTCGPPGASQTIEEVTVRYEYLWFFRGEQRLSSPVLVVQACGDPRLVVDWLSRP